MGNKMIFRILFLLFFTGLNAGNFYVNDAVVEIVEDKNEKEEVQGVKEDKKEDSPFRLKIGDRLSLQIYVDPSSFKYV
ncbi:MAG: hypothetical protein ACK4HV_00115 [Parachlamydiaceae bacterium]